jgi:hypothetical protein
MTADGSQPLTHRGVGSPRWCRLSPYTTRAITVHPRCTKCGQPAKPYIRVHSRWLRHTYLRDHGLQAAIGGGEAGVREAVASTHLAGGSAKRPALASAPGGGTMSTASPTPSSRPTRAGGDRWCGDRWHGSSRSRDRTRRAAAIASAAGAARQIIHPGDGEASRCGCPPISGARTILRI